MPTTLRAGFSDWPIFCWLRKIKAKYNPHNVFQYEQSIPPATW
ncbi:BBE domain-containing protein [Streptantibioticus silvisoli]|jgi:hypothetical protein|uniref:BBE domain-containing protein n=1 Tax=Streptantibioticus silvisoli TaxID=2705255 RepID=A0ABT6VS78_9ACTN|nr:BBE domain-containing protein [Streptantibioticus silvisoli]MDI5961332.1 BBE domain-containing protein [Streptantibioticus silvisoli]